MVDFRPRIEEATEPGARMDALCEFIEFWLGPRQASCGEPAESLAAHALPMPLHRLYEFAGRWPRWDGRRFGCRELRDKGLLNRQELELPIDTGGY